MDENTAKKMAEINTGLSVGIKLILAPFFLLLGLFMIFLGGCLIYLIFSML